jgi:cobaltochelatase CobT
MAAAQSLERAQQQTEELCAAAIRALSGEPDLHFRGGRLHHAGRRLPAFAPHLHPAVGEDDFVSFRGAADGLALRLAFSDAALQRSQCPDEPTARVLFSLLEQMRVEALADPQMPGVRHNLAHRFEQWSLAFHHSGLTETLSGLTVYTLAQMVRARVLGGGVLPHTEDLIETTRGRLAGLIGHELAALRRHRDEQAAYGTAARAIAERVATLLHGLAAQAGGLKPSAREADESNAHRFSLWLALDADLEASDAAAPVASTSRSEVLDGAGGRYRAFTTAYDREHPAATLVRPELLREYRERLDAQVAQSGLNVGRLARQLKAVLAEPQQDGTEGAQEEGRIDGARLAQLITSPAERRLFRADRVEPVAHTALTLLIDCSGSMKQHTLPLAMLVDVMARALEAAGATSEVLGYTTGAWNGGRALRDWQRAGRLPQPGRLNERCHLVFKDADTSWRRARLAIAALLKADLFREGLDGEAVEWAAMRLLARPEPRRVLMVLSDGCPMDRATQLANDNTYLGQHLLQVVQRLEQAGPAESLQVFGVGVGLDLSMFYSRCQAIDFGAGLGHATLDEIVGLVGGRRRR